MKKNFFLPNFIFGFLLVLSIFPSVLSYAEGTEESPDDGIKATTPILSSEYSTIYDKQGNFVTGAPLNYDDKQVFQLMYKGPKLGKDAIDKDYVTDLIEDSMDVTTEHGSKMEGLQNTRYIRVKLMKGDTFYFDNIGSYNGEKLKLAIAATNQDLYINVQRNDASIMIENYNGNAPYKYRSDYKYWVVDSKNNLFKEDDLYFVVNNSYMFANRDDTNNRPVLSTSAFVNYTLSGPGNLIDSTLTTNENLINSDRYSPSKFVTIDKTNNKGTDILKISQTKYGNRDDDHPYMPSYQARISYIYHQQSPMRYTGQQYLSNEKAGGVALYAFGTRDNYFFSPSVVPFPTPYGYPMMEETINNDTNKNANKVKFKAVQMLSSQAIDDFYASPLKITVNLADKNKFLDKSSINSKNFKVYDNSGNDITNKTSVTIPTSGDDAGKVVVSISRGQLKELGDTSISIEGFLPVNQNNPELLKYITDDGYIPVEGVSIKNSKNKKETSKVMKVKVPGPTADPITTGVIEGTSTDSLTPSNLVTNIKPSLKGDSVSIEGFEKPKTFDKVGTDSVSVVLKSQKVPSVKSSIKVPIEVYEKDSPMLKSMEIIPEKDKVAHSKEELVYSPSFKQNLEPIKPISDTSKVFNTAKIKINYNKVLPVKQSDFTITQSGNLIDSSKYKTDIDAKLGIVTFTFEKSVLNNELKNKEIVIKNKTMIPTQANAKEIMTAYNKEEKSFDFDISGVTSWNYTEGKPYIFSQNVNELQRIYYEPAISADPVTEQTVKVGEEVKPAEKYIKNLSKPDFDFDQYDITFKKKPDFSTAGVKDFTILITSKEFGTVREVPVSVKVLEPLVKMTIHHVYRDDENQNIYSNLDAKEIVPADPPILVKPGEDILTLIDSYAAQKKIKLNYDNYLAITDEQGDLYKDNLKASIDKENPIKDFIVPNSNFDVMLLYKGITNLKNVPSYLNYGSVDRLNPFSKYIPLSEDSVEQTVTVSDTTLNNNWKLTLSNPKGLVNPQTDEPLLGSLVYFDKDHEKYGIDIKDEQKVIEPKSNSDSLIFKFDIGSETNVNRGLKLRLDGTSSSGNYEGKAVWTIIDGP